MNTLILDFNLCTTLLNHFNHQTLSEAVANEQRLFGQPYRSNYNVQYAA